jgi:hypothetical protein
MKLVNVDRETYFNAYYGAEGRGTEEERQKLRDPKSGLFPDNLFRKRLWLGTWLSALRADMRGKVAFPKLIEPEFKEVTTPSGHKFQQRQRPSKEALKKAHAVQHAMLAKMMEECPKFFSGMIVSDDYRPAKKADPVVRAEPAQPPMKEEPKKESFLGSVLGAFKSLVRA